MTKHLLLLFTAILLLTINGAAQSHRTHSKPSAITNIRNVSFLNYTYDSTLCAETFGLPASVKIRSGKYKDKENYFQIKDNRVIYGDLTGDGREEAVVHIKCGSYAGNFNNSEIFIYTLQNGRAKLLAKVDSDGLESDYKSFFPEGFLVTVKSAAVSKGRLIIEAYADGSNAGPIHIATFNCKVSRSGVSFSGKPRVRRSKLG